MSRDRLMELGNNSSRGHAAQQPRIEMRSASVMNSFAQQSSEIKASIDRITRNTRELQGLHRKALVEIQSSQAQALSQQVDSLIDQTSGIIQQTRNALKGLSSASGADATVKQVQQKALARKLMDAARDYQSIQQQAKQQYRQQLERQFKIAKPNATREEVRQAIDDGGSNVFQQQILSSRVGDQRRMLQDVQNRQHEMQKIEQSLIELFELMQDMQMLLEQQQTFVNAIETNIDDSAVNMEMGSTELTKATENSRSSRKKKWIIFCLCIVLLAVAGVVLYFEVIAPFIKANAAKPAPTN